MLYILIAIMIFFYSCQTVFMRCFSEAYPQDKKISPFVYTVVGAMFIALVSFVIGGFEFSPSGMTVLFGALNSVSLIGYYFFIMSASAIGPYSVMMVFSVAGGIIVPAVIAHFAFGDEISIISILSMIVMLISVYLMSCKGKDTENKQKISLRFLIYSTFIALSNGLYGALFDIQQRIMQTAEREEMVSISFGLASLISLAAIIIMKKKKSVSAFRQNKRSLTFMCLCMIVAAIAVNIMAYVIPRVDITILYMVQNSSVMLLSVLASAVLFREKLTTLNIIGAVTMCISLVVAPLF